MARFSWALLFLLAVPGLRAETVASPNGRVTWEEEDSFVTFRKRTGKGPREKTTRIRLPPEPKEAARRRLIFSNNGDYFCVLDETENAIGLHLSLRRGADNAKALVVDSLLRLMDKRGRVRWTRRLRDKHLVGQAGEAGAPRLAQNGSLAVLLQDTGPYAKGNPNLHVIDRKGSDLLSLDYTSWTRIDAFALSEDGTALAVHGIGLIPDDETWGKALGRYGIEDETRWVRATPLSSESGHLGIVADNGWTCCINEGRSFVAFSPTGIPEKISPADMRRRYAVEP